MAPESSFRDVCRRLELHGWTLNRIRGSHHVFTKDGELPISIPVHHNRVKDVYVRKIEKILRKSGE